VTTILVSAGDASGEAHAAGLVEAIREQRPDARFLGMGGVRMAEAGVEIVVDQRELAVGGLFELVTSVRRLRRAWRRMVDCVRRERPDLVVLVDSGGFNLPLARRIRRIAPTPILYYAAPQIWAWRPGRLRKLAARVDRIAVILPFERDYYRARGVEVDYVGHPALDGLAAGPSAAIGAGSRRSSARERLGLEQADEVLAILPGSRRNELARHLAIQVEAFAHLRTRRPGLRGLIGLAPSLDRGAAVALLAAMDPRLRRGLEIVCGQTDRVMDAADVALAKPGTITVELMLRETPMVVIGRVHPWTAWIARRAVGLDWLSMPNLIAGEAVVPELLQAEARPDRIADALAPLFEGPERLRQIEGLARARRRLGEPGAARRTGVIVEEMLGSLGAA
jgi:lipid-A-disaccharide synthase